MERGARSPDELETMLEDAFVIQRHEDVANLFDPAAVLAVRCSDSSPEVCGRAAIGALAASLWDRGATFIADSGRTVYGRRRALVVGPGLTAVLHRGPGGTWRFEIALLTPTAITTRRDHR